MVELTYLLRLIAFFAAGVALATVYFALLWYATRRLLAERTPGVSQVLQLLVRLAVVLGGFYFIVRLHQWQAVVAALAGFVLVRIVIVRRMRRTTGKPAGGQVSGS